MLRPRTLFARTALAMTLALLLFVLLTGFLVYRYILSPVGHQAADDLAALMVLSARTWAELPPVTRPDFVEELARNHRLLLREEPPAEKIEPLGYHAPYLQFLSESLARRLDEPARLYQVPDMEEWFWTAIPVAGRELHLGFSHARIGARPPKVLLGLLAGAALFVLLTNLFLVRLINRPLARLDAGVQQLGRRGFSDPLPETGPRELARLARRFNEMSVEIRQLLDNRTTLLGGISHDLRTPLARMGLALEMLDGKEEASLIRQMRADLEEMNRIIGRSLELAGLVHGGDRPDEHLPLSDLLETLRSAYLREGQEIRLRLTGECRTEVPALPLQRILGNLLDNAFHYGGRQPVELDLECRKGRIRLCVRDRGPGIPEEELEAVFQPFHRLEPSRNRETGGSGLGLAIVRQIADARGWRVNLRNHPDGGLEACVVLGE